MNIGPFEALNSLVNHAYDSGHMRRSSSPTVVLQKFGDQQDEEDLDIVDNPPRFEQNRKYGTVSRWLRKNTRPRHRPGPEHHHLRQPDPDSEHSDPEDPTITDRALQSAARQLNQRVMDRSSSLEEVTRNADRLNNKDQLNKDQICLLYTSPSPRDATLSRMPSSA